jgi:hypothetical protein
MGLEFIIKDVKSKELMDEFLREYPDLVSVAIREAVVAYTIFLELRKPSSNLRYSIPTTVGLETFIQPAQAPAAPSVVLTQDPIPWKVQGGETTPKLKNAGGEPPRGIFTPANEVELSPIPNVGEGECVGNAIDSIIHDEMMMRHDVSITKVGIESLEAMGQDTRVHNNAPEQVNKNLL